MLKNKKRISTTLTFELLERVQNYSEKTGVPISKIIDFALTEYLNSKEKES